MESLTIWIVLSLVLLLIYGAMRVMAMVWGLAAKKHDKKRSEDAERKALEAFDKYKAGLLHPAQVFVDGKALENIKDLSLKLENHRQKKYKNQLEKDRAVDRNNQHSQRGNYTEEININTDSNWVKVSDTPKWDNVEQMISDTPSPNYAPYDGAGHGGSFGGGGASGSWDTDSSSSSYFDSSSSDSGSSDSGSSD